MDERKKERWRQSWIRKDEGGSENEWTKYMRRESGEGNQAEESEWMSELIVTRSSMFRVIACRNQQAYMSPKTTIWST